MFSPTNISPFMKSQFKSECFKGGKQHVKVVFRFQTLPLLFFTAVTRNLTPARECSPRQLKRIVSCYATSGTTNDHCSWLSARRRRVYRELKSTPWQKRKQIQSKYHGRAHWQLVEETPGPAAINRRITHTHTQTRLRRLLLIATQRLALATPPKSK